MGFAVGRRVDTGDVRSTSASGAAPSATGVSNASNGTASAASGAPSTADGLCTILPASPKLGIGTYAGSDAGSDASTSECTAPVMVPSSCDPGKECGNRGEGGGTSHLSSKEDSSEKINLLSKQRRKQRSHRNRKKQKR